MSPLHRIVRTVSLVLLACPAAALAQDNTSVCGPLTNAYGPFDYRTQRDKLQVVEEHHFTPKVESLLAGQEVDEPRGPGRSSQGEDLLDQGSVLRRPGLGGQRGAAFDEVVRRARVQLVGGGVEIHGGWAAGLRRRVRPAPPRPSNRRSRAARCRSGGCCPPSRRPASGRGRCGRRAPRRRSPG